LGDVTSQGGVIDNIEPTNIVNTGSSPLSAKNFRLNPAGCAGGLCTLEANGALTETGSATLNLINANNANQKLTVSNINFWQNARLVSSRISVNNVPADGVYQNEVKLKVVDRNGNVLPAGKAVRLTYTLSPTSGSTAWPPSGSDIFTVDGNSEIPIVISSTNKPSVTDFSPAQSSIAISVPGWLPGGVTTTSQTMNFVYNAQLVGFTIGVDGAKADNVEQNVIYAHFVKYDGSPAAGVEVFARPMGTPSVSPVPYSTSYTGYLPPNPFGVFGTTDSSGRLAIPMKFRHIPGGSVQADFASMGSGLVGFPATQSVTVQFTRTRCTSRMERIADGSGRQFSCPLSAQEAAALGLPNHSASGYWAFGSAANVSAYCATQGGRIPTKTELTRLYDRYPAPALANANWPAEEQYVTREGGREYVFRLLSRPLSGFQNEVAAGYGSGVYMCVW
ncbi:MAG: hypothetical protein ACRC9W_04480, partial [Plesiomonas sp.]